MSTSGVQSNRGDSFELYVAFEWAIRVFSDPTLEWIEVDSVSNLVDDVVIGAKDGSRICIQCKKNQKRHNSWTISDLRSELEKAVHDLDRDSGSEVRFVSRSNFGCLNHLREYLSMFPDEATALLEIPKVHVQPFNELKSIIEEISNSLSVYEFLQRTKFEVKGEFQTMEMDIRERLRGLVSHEESAFNAIWTKLSKLGGRVQERAEPSHVSHRLTESDLRAALEECGSLPRPSLSIIELREYVSRISSVGRIWKRDILNSVLPTSYSGEIRQAIMQGKRSILVTGKPGSGKTCTLLQLADDLEKQSTEGGDVVPVFIQAREFSESSGDLPVSNFKSAQRLTNAIARLAEEAHVILIIDSLDSLSIAREQKTLAAVLRILDQLMRVPRVTIIASCRAFDLEFDRRLATRNWDCSIHCKDLRWDEQVVPFLKQVGLKSEYMDDPTKELIKNPRQLCLYVEVACKTGELMPYAGEELAELYLDGVVRKNPNLGDPAIEALELLAVEMVEKRSLSLPVQRFMGSSSAFRELCSLNVLLEGARGSITFGHQTLVDVLVLRRSARNGETLNELIKKLPNVPFVRPTIRAFAQNLSRGSRKIFRKQVRTVLLSDHPYHIQRLVANVYSRTKPSNSDWPLIRQIRLESPELFQVIYDRADDPSWNLIWEKFLLPEIEHKRNPEEIVAHVQQTAKWLNSDTGRVLRVWKKSLDIDWIDKAVLAYRMCALLQKLEKENLSPAVPLVREIINVVPAGQSGIGALLARCVDAGLIGDVELWDFIVAGVKVDGYSPVTGIRCEPWEFGSKRDRFLENRLIESRSLLSIAIEAIEDWSRACAARVSANPITPHDYFLEHTSYQDVRSIGEPSLRGAKETLLRGIEDAVIYHARENSEWWQNNAKRLAFSHEIALRYISILALIERPLGNNGLVGEVLRDESHLSSPLGFEIAELIRKSFPLLEKDVQLGVVNALEGRLDEQIGLEESECHNYKGLVGVVASIPCHIRSGRLQGVVDRHLAIHGLIEFRPSISAASGRTIAPVSAEEIGTLSKTGVVKLLQHYTGFSPKWGELLLGGEREVGWQLRKASSKDPEKFLSILGDYWERIPVDYREEIVEGIGDSIREFRRLDSTNNPRSAGNDLPGTIQGLVGHAVSELKRRRRFWRSRRSAANLMSACSAFISNRKVARSVVELCEEFTSREKRRVERGDFKARIEQSLNSTEGQIVESLMLLASNLSAQNVEYPSQLAPLLSSFAAGNCPSTRAHLLWRLPMLANLNQTLGWELYQEAIQGGGTLWRAGETWMYYQYNRHFVGVAPWLDKLFNEGHGKELETWGRISALAALAGHLDIDSLLKNLRLKDSPEAWVGSASVWTNQSNMNQQTDQCVKGLMAALTLASENDLEIVKHVFRLFDGDENHFEVPSDLLETCFILLTGESEGGNWDLYGLHDWLNKISDVNPELALNVAAVYFDFARDGVKYFYDYEQRLAQMVTSLFREAEEREDIDQGNMLKRVLKLQDQLLLLGCNSMDSWLISAERP